MTIGKKFNELNSEEYIFSLIIIRITKILTFSDYTGRLLKRGNCLWKIKSRYENMLIVYSKRVSIFFNLKTPHIFVEVSTLGMNLTQADVTKIWDDIRKNQQDILKDKRIKYRHFGTYSKHDCPYEDCIYQGLMVRPDSRLAWTNMHFDSDNKYEPKAKSERRRLYRKRKRSIIKEQIDS